MSDGLSILADHWLLVLVGALVWVEITRRLLALMEAELKRRVGVIPILITTLFWPVFFVVALVVNFWRLPRSWKPDKTEGPPS